MPGRGGSSEAYRYGFNGMEKDDEGEVGSQTTYTTAYRQYNPAIGRFFSVDLLAADYTDWSPYNYVLGNPIRLVDPTGLAPECEDCPDKTYVPLAEHVYTAKKGEVSSNGWEVIRVDKNDKNGFKGALYRGTTDSGYEGEHIYATAGTEMTDLGDWSNNIDQGTGFFAPQYSESVGHANDLVLNEKYEGVSFTGHSLGGGLASANALSTGGKAVTFNAAGLSRQNKERLGVSGLTANITAYIVAGEALNGLQRNIGLKAMANHIIYLPSFGKNTVEKHFMTNVKAAFSIYQDLKENPNIKTFNLGL